MGTSSNVNFDKDKNEIFSVERINKKEYLLKTSSHNFCLDDKKELLLSKLNTLLKLSPYKNSVKFIGYYEDEENINIVTEKCEMNLLEYLNKKGKLDFDEIKSIFIQLNNIFHIMLNNNVIHKIIKLQNILLKLNSNYNQNKKNININDYTIKLSDYGNEVLIKEYLKYGKFDEIISIAPEILKGQNYDNKIDLFSIGIVMYQLYFSENPFGNNLAEINYKISRDQNNFKLSGNDIFDDLLKSLLQFNPENRISWDNYFNHKFFKDDISKNNLNNNDDLLNLQYIIRNDEDKFDLPTKRSNENTNIENNQKNISKFNLKFRSNIKSENNILNFKEKNIGNEGLELLSKIQFKEIEELNLTYNKIYDINYISKIKLMQLIKLDISHNKINNINEFENCNFSQLIELRLSFNQINDINILEKCDLSKLKFLYLSNNKITNINTLDKCNFYLLNELYLSNNEIEDISVLSNCNFNILQKLGLSENKINNIDVFSSCCFVELKKLYLYGNNIDNIDVFSKCNFLELNELYLYNNNINNIEVFEKCNFTKLKELSLYNNKIDNLDIINKLREKNINVYY